MCGSTTTTESRGGGVVFYVNDVLGCEEIKNGVDEREYFGAGVTLGKRGMRLCVGACWGGAAAISCRG